MKKIAFLLLIASMAMMTACGSKAEAPAKEEAAEVSEEVSEELSAEDEKPEPAEAGDENEAAPTGEEDLESTGQSGPVVIFDLEVDEVLPVLGKDLLLTYGEDKSEDDWGGSMHLKYDGQDLEVVDYCEWIISSYVVPIDENSFYVMAEAGYSNDWVNSHLVKYENGKLESVAEAQGFAVDVSNLLSGEAVFETRVDCFGTYGVKIPMKLKDGKFERIDQCITFTVYDPDPDFKAWFDAADGDQKEYLNAIYDENGGKLLTAKQAFSCENAEGYEVKIAEGDKIVPVKFDPDNHIFYFDYQGQDCCFKYEVKSEGYGFSVNGVSEDDLFVVLPYAG